MKKIIENSMNNQLKSIVSVYHGKVIGAVICGSLLSKMTKEELQSIIIMLSEQQSKIIRKHEKEMMLLKKQQDGETIN